MNKVSDYGGNFYVGEIQIFAGNFPPEGWLFCNGAIYAAQLYPMLYSLLGDWYGGNGTSTFGVPDLRTRVPVHSADGNAGIGLSAYQLAESGGLPTKTITEDNLPAHTHNAVAVNAFATTGIPDKTLMPAMGTRQFGPPSQRGRNMYAPATDPRTIMNPSALSNSDGVSAETVDNHQPYLVCNYIIASDDVFDAVYPNRY